MEIKRKVYLIYYKGEIVDEVVAVSEQDALYQYGVREFTKVFKAVRN